MVGGPVFGPQPRLKQALFVAAPVATVLLLLWLLFGCAAPEIRYRSVPVNLIPPSPTLPTIRSDEMACLSDDTYVKLATRDRTLRQHVDELRALFGVQ